MKDKIQIVLAEDHTIVREGLKMLLSSKPEFHIAGEASDGFEAIQCVDRLEPELLLIDLSMPRMNGIEAIIEIKKRHHHTKILILTVHNTEEHIQAALKAGADGYVLKDATHTELLIAIDSVLSGKCYLSPGVSNMVIQGYLNGGEVSPPSSPWDTLTKREREVLKMIAEGYKNKEIADYLYISVKTVEKHRTNLMKKLNIHNVSALTTYAIEKGLLVINRH